MSAVAGIVGLLTHFDGFTLPVIFLNVHIPVFVDVDVDDAIDEYIAAVAISAVIVIPAVEKAAGRITRIVVIDALIRRRQNVDIHPAVNHHRCRGWCRCDFHIGWRRGRWTVRTDFATDDGRAGDGEGRCGPQMLRLLKQGFLREFPPPYKTVLS
jgi:hypothetical protein